MSNADLVSVWFAEKMATGPLSRNDAAHDQAIQAKDDLVERLDAAKGAAADTVAAWFAEKIATGDIARDTEAYNQAFAAKTDLIGRLDAADAEPLTPKPAKSPAKASPPSQPETAAPSAPAED
jgi:hypothetical protein